MPKIKPEQFDVKRGGIVEVYFADDCVLRFVPPLRIPLRHRAIRNVQLLKAGNRVAQYDGVIDFCSADHPDAGKLMPRAVVLGDATVLIEYWEPAVPFLKSKPKWSRHGSSSDNYADLAKWAKGVASISQTDLKTLKRNIENERRNHERQSS